MTLLEIAERGDLSLLTERLEWVCRRIGGGRAPLSDDEKLLQEALWYARACDLDEAQFRLRCRARPKFYEERECKRLYEAAMKEKRARTAA